MFLKLRSRDLTIVQLIALNTYCISNRFNLFFSNLRYEEYWTKDADTWIKKLQTEMACALNTEETSCSRALKSRDTGLVEAESERHEYCWIKSILLNTRHLVWHTGRQVRGWGGVAVLEVKRHCWIVHPLVHNVLSPFRKGCFFFSSCLRSGGIFLSWRTNQVVTVCVRTYFRVNVYAKHGFQCTINSQNKNYKNSETYTKNVMFVRTIYLLNTCIIFMRPFLKTLKYKNY